MQVLVAGFKDDLFLSDIYLATRTMPNTNEPVRARTALFHFTTMSAYIYFGFHYLLRAYRSQADYHQNPFASTHSLDANPFDDPQQQSDTSQATREQDLRRREEELQRRESELNNRTEHIRRHGRNNFPPCGP